MREIEFPKPIDKAIFKDGKQVIGAVTVRLVSPLQGSPR
jgi:hypothetical protein